MTAELHLDHSHTLCKCFHADSLQCLHISHFSLLSNLCFPLFPSAGVFSHAVLVSVLMDYTAQSHCKDTHNVLLQESDLRQVTYTPLSCKNTR